MSHFTVMVVGEDPEYQLAPFHEYECTGRDDEFVVDVDITEEIEADFEQYGQQRDIKTFAEEWAGAEMRDGRFYRHTNPNKKWDWWTVGGRWGGLLALKSGRVGRDFRIERPSYEEKNKPSVPGGKCDQARAGDIDWEAMRSAARKKAEEIYDLADPKELWETWDTVRERHKNDINLARKLYREQPGFVAVVERLKDTVGFFFVYDDLLKGREAYCTTAANSGVSTFAFVQNREWFEKGDMGWFAMVSDEKDQDDWNAIVWKKIRELPDDALVTIVDCHI